MSDEIDVKELTKLRDQKDAEIKEGIKAIEINGNEIKMSQTHYDEIVKKDSELKQIENLIAMGTRDYEAASAPESVAMHVNTKDVRQFTTLGDLFTESKIFKDFQRSGKTSMDTDFVLEAPDVTRYGTFIERKDVYTEAMPPTSTRGFGSSADAGYYMPLRRPLRVRDLFPSRSTNANLIDFYLVRGFDESDSADPDYGNAAAVPERTGTPPNDVFGLKPHSKIVFTNDHSPVVTIAHWEAISRNVLADEPRLRSIINEQLLFGLALYEDEQILNGSGVGENLRGILNTPGIQLYDASSDGVAGDQRSDTLRRALTRVMLTNAPATGVVMHPFDWERLELQKADGSAGDGDGHYMLVNNVSIGANATVWRQPVVETVSIAEGTFLTGSFNLGAELWDRERATVRIAEQHADYFVRNAIVVLAESRLALVVPRPNAFVKGSWV
jgi:HK97 family phage major capsid protein